MAYIQLGGQNWLITPTVQDKFLLVLTGVAEINFSGTGGDTGNLETVTILPDVISPLRFAMANYGVSQPSGSGDPAFDLEQWAPFVGLGGVFVKAQGLDAFFGVENWKPTPFLPPTRSIPGATHIFQGVDVEVSALPGLSTLVTVNYHITLLGRVVFLPHAG